MWILTVIQQALLLFMGFVPKKKICVLSYNKKSFEGKSYHEVTGREHSVQEGLWGVGWGGSGGGGGSPGKRGQGIQRLSQVTGAETRMGQQATARGRRRVAGWG